MKKAHRYFAMMLLMLTLLVGADCCHFAYPATPVLAAAAPTRTLPILMYHQVAASRHGKYIVSVAQLESDFQAIVAAGYTPVFLREVEAWVNGQGTLPAKPIVITFDDGQYNNVYYVLPLAQKYQIKYEINPVTSYSEKSIRDHDTENPRYSNLSWEAIKTAYDSGLVEIGNHTHNLHNTGSRYGIGKKAGESLADYTQTITADITHAQELLTACGISTPTVFAYPFGKCQPEAKQILLDLGFQTLLTCNEHVNTITQGDPTCLHALGRFNRSGNTSTHKIMQKIAVHD